LYSFHQLPEEAQYVLSAANDCIARSEVPSEDTYSVYLCPHRFVFFLSAFLAYDAFAVAQWNSIFVANADVVNNVAYSGHATNNKRTLSGVIAHEAGHVLLAKKFGAISHRYFLPTWKVEGYCDYLAQDSSFDEENGIKCILLGQVPDSHSFRYFLWRKRVEYLIEVKRMDLDSVFRDNPVLLDLDKEVSEWLKMMAEPSGPLIKH